MYRAVKELFSGDDIKKYYPDFIPPRSIQDIIKDQEKQKIIESINKKLETLFKIGYFSLTNL